MSTQCISIEKQGILSILGSDSDQRSIKAAASIKRTLSADMSHNKWLSKNVENNSSSSDEESEDEQLNKENLKTFDWSSILSNKNNEQDSSNNTLSPPYIHPLVKRSNSSLSEKSLEICTESLGSETGSDCFSSSPPKNEDLDVNEDEQQQQQHSSFEDFHVVKYNNTKRLSSPRSFPPPLPSTHMQSRRQDGRLILEVVSVPPKNYFHSQRLDGRLLLTYHDQGKIENHVEEVQEFEQVFDDIKEAEVNKTPLSDEYGDDEDEFEEEDKKEEVEDVERKGIGIVMEQSQRSPSEVVVLFEITLVAHRFNNSVNSMMQVEKDSIIRECYTCHSSVPQSLPLSRRVAQAIPAPPPPPPAAVASFNAYDYFWKKKPIVDNPTIDDKCSKNNYYSNNQVVLTAVNGTGPKATITTNKAGYEQQDLVVYRGNRASMNNLVPLVRSCKEPRRSLLIWEPYCIATS